MEPEKQTTFDSNATTPTRVSVDNAREPCHPSGDTLEEEKSNELRAMETRRTLELEGTSAIHRQLSDVEQQEEEIERKEHGEAPKDPNLVEWDGPDDPENPQNWPKWKKWVYTMTLSSLTVWITFASSVFSEATVVTAKQFHVSTEVMTLGTSLTVFVSISISVRSSVALYHILLQLGNGDQVESMLILPRVSLSVPSYGAPCPNCTVVCRRCLSDMPSLPSSRSPSPLLRICRLSWCVDSSWVFLAVRRWQ